MKLEEACPHVKNASCRYSLGPDRHVFANRMDLVP